MTSTRDQILNRLRAARGGQEFAPPRPNTYHPVTLIDDTSPAGLLARTTAELERLKGFVHAAADDAAAIAKVLALLAEYNVAHALTWEFDHLPPAGLKDALAGAGITVTHPVLHTENRPEVAAFIETAGAGIIGCDALAATTGTLIVTTGPGKSRAATVLPPVLIALVRQSQLIPRLEDWFAGQRAAGMPAMHDSANVCFITGPSRTGDIEMQLVLGVHGPGIVHVIVIQEGSSTP